MMLSQAEVLEELVRVQRERKATAAIGCSEQPIEIDAVYRAMEMELMRVLELRG